MIGRGIRIDLHSCRIIWLDTMEDLRVNNDVGRLELVLPDSSYPLTLCTGRMLQGHVGVYSLHAKEAYLKILRVARSKQIPTGEAMMIYIKIPVADEVVIKL
jgi:hypothetical protein